MGAPKRPQLISEAQRRNLEVLPRLGSEVRRSRTRRRLSQRALATDVGLAQSTISLLERGHGGRLSLDTWQLIGLAVGRQMRFELSADALAEPADAGHLAMQELVLRLGRQAGFARTFELPIRPVAPAGWGDVGLRDDRRRLLALVECWNTIGDLGAGARASDRKRAEAEQLAVAIGPLDGAAVAQPYRVRSCWVVRATARNRALVARYPEVFAARFPGSSAGWVRALTEGTEPPEKSGLVWCDTRAMRLIACRRQ